MDLKNINQKTSAYSAIPDTKSDSKPASDGKKFRKEMGQDALGVNGSDTVGRSMVQQSDPQTRFKNAVLKCEYLDDSNQAELLRNIDNVTEENVDYKTDIMNKAFSRMDLKDDDYAMAGFSCLIDAVNNKNQYDIANRVLTDDDLKYNRNLIWEIDTIVQGANSDAKADLMNKFLDKTDLHQDYNEMRTFIKYIKSLAPTDTLESSYNIKLIDKILTDDLYKNKDVVDLFKDFQNKNEKEKIPTAMGNMKNEFLYKALLNSDLSNIAICKELYDSIRYYTDIKNLARADVLEFIQKESEGKKFFVHKDTEENCYTLQTFKNGHTNIFNFKVAEDGIENNSNSIERGIFAEKKENADGSYVISDRKKGHNLKTVYNDEGVPVYSEVVKKDKKDHFTITRYERGLNQPMSKNEIATDGYYGSKSQGEKVERNFETRGVKTHYKSIQGPKGYSMEYRFGDLSKNVKHRIIDDNHTESVVNGVHYETDFTNGITVVRTDKKGKKKTIKLDNYQLDPNLNNLYRNLTGDVFFGLYKYNVKTVLGGEASPDNACYSKWKNTIFMSEELKDNVFTFMHEYGHVLDEKKNTMRSDENLKKIFLEELHEFRKEGSNDEELDMDYFLRPYDERGKGFLLGSLGEIVAETTALFSGVADHKTSERVNKRSILLQKHFPNTISYIAESLPEIGVVNEHQD